MLPLIPMAISMTLLMGATLFVASPSDERHATATLADDMLRYHQAVNRAAADRVASLDRDLGDQQDGLMLGPFTPLVGWQSAIAEERADGTVTAYWVVTWPVTFDDGSMMKKGDLAAIPGKLRAAGFSNSRLCAWSAPYSTNEAPSGRMDGLTLWGVTIPEGAPVIADFLCSGNATACVN